MAEGIDIDNPDFIRADGSHVFVDYKDFSGDGRHAPTSGGEAFLDASAIASQGKTYDVSHFGAVPLAPLSYPGRGCRPRGVLVGIKIFAQNGYSTTSGILRASTTPSPPTMSTFSTSHSVTTRSPWSRPRTS